MGAKHGQPIEIPVVADTRCVVAFEEGIDFDIERAGNLRSMLFGGERLRLRLLGSDARRELGFFLRSDSKKSCGVKKNQAHIQLL